MDYIYLVTCLITFTITFVIDFVQSRRLGESIVGGVVATPGIHAYAVSVQIHNKHVCGGSIIGAYFILTAAHCVIEDDNNFINNEMTVVVGTLKVMDLHNPITRILVEKVYVPTKYKRIDFNKLTNKSPGEGMETADIAILKLSKELYINRNSGLRKLDLPKKSGVNYPTYETERPMVSGYGYELILNDYDSVNKKRREIPIMSKHRLKYAETVVIPQMLCKNKFVMNLDEGQLCAQVLQHHRSKPEGICTGDSGSPLALGNYIIGIASFSFPGCDESRYPAVYTRVSSFITFITNVMYDVQSDDIRIKTYRSILQ